MKTRFDYRCGDYAGLSRDADLSLDLQEIHLPDESLDLVLVPHVLQYVPEIHKALEELRRILRRAGKAFIQIPMLQGKSSAPVETDSREENGRLQWRFGWDLTDIIRDHGFECTALIPHDLHQQCIARRFTGAILSPEFDVDSIIAESRPTDLTTVSSDAVSDLYGFTPSYMFVVWECTK